LEHRPPGDVRPRHASVNAMNAGMLCRKVPSVPNIVGGHEKRKAPQRQLAREASQQRADRESDEHLRALRELVAIAENEGECDPTMGGREEINLPKSDAERTAVFAQLFKTAC